MRLKIFKEHAARIPRTKLQALFDRIVQGEADPADPASVHVVFTHDDRLQELNREFRRKDRATDVLSFNIDEPSDPDGVFGEIYISIPTATRQAESYGAPLSEELIRLACHGLLHLCGYDHMQADDAVRMKEREEHYLVR